MATPTLVFVALLLVVSETFYIGLARHDAVSSMASVGQFLAWMGALFLLYGCACWMVARPTAGTTSVAVGCRHRRHLLIVIGIGAVAFRLTVAGAGLSGDRSFANQIDSARADLTGRAVGFDRYLLYDDDIWRYLWDGHVLARGENPYVLAPIDPRADRFADPDTAAAGDPSQWPDIRDNINHPAIPTIYPPLAQGAFLIAHALAPGSVLAMKAVVIVADLLAVLFVALALRATGRAPELCLLYAWNPLVIKVFAGSAHVDALLVAALAACAYFIAQRAAAAAGAAFGLAVLGKLSPLILLPFVARRVGWRGTAVAAAVVVAGYLPFASAGSGLWQGLATFSAHWEFNAGLYAAIAALLAALSTAGPASARVVAGAAILLCLATLVLLDDGRDDTFAGIAALALGALLVFSPVVMPWYVTWILPLAAIANQRTWLWFSGLVCLAFLVMVDGRERVWYRVVEYGVFAIIAWQAWRTTRPGRAVAVARYSCIATVRM